MNKYQIIRMNNGKQQHYDVELKKFETSKDRWSGVFAAAENDAQKLFAEIRSNCRKTNVCTMPTLSIIK
jgi:hypothetical protein